MSQRENIDIDQAFGPDGLLAKKLAGYKERPQQVELAERIGEAFQLGSSLIAEAPTGVGKSIAALVPAMQKIKNEDARVLVVTSSILLQGQYMEKDIPFLENIFGLDTNPVLIKGKSNYLCLRKMQSPQELSKVHPQNSGQWQRIKEWSQVTKEGDLGELDFRPTADVRSATSIVKQTECKKSTCSFASSCFYYKNKGKLKESKLVVCNYHYLFTAFEVGDFDMMFGGEFDYVVYDEAHEIVNIARDFLAKTLSRKSLDSQYAHMMALGSLVGNRGLRNATDFHNKFDYASVANNINDVFDGIYRSFTSTKQRYKDTMIYDNQTFIKGSLEDLVNWYRKLMNDVSSLSSNYLPEEDERKELTDEEHAWCLSVEDFYTTVESSYTAALSMLQDPDGWITWAEYAFNKAKDDDVRYVHKPHDVSELVGNLFSRFEGTVCMSATMLVGDSLDYFANQLGVPDNREDLIVETPFELEKNMLWYLPADCPDGNNTLEHADFAIREMHRIAEELKGKTLCLFTSNKNMRLAKQYFEDHKIPGVVVMSQDDFQKERIVEAMRLKSNIVVLGTKSFFTGVDIQGPNLSAVLIDKIPFPMMGDPINEFLANQRNGFFKFMLPEAIITLKQAVGRLNRTEADRGIISVLDGRLGNKPYRVKIFNSFRHKVNGARDFKAVVDFFEEVPS